LTGIAGFGLVLAVLGGLAWLLPEWRERVRVQVLPGEPAELAAITVSELRESCAALFEHGLLLAFFSGALAALANWRDSRRDAALFALAGLGLLELTLTAHAATPTISKDFYEKPPFLARFLQARPGEPAPRFYPATRDDRIPRAFERAYADGYWEFDKERLRANLATAWDLEQFHNYNPGKLAWMNKLEWCLEGDAGTGPVQRSLLLRGAGVERVVSRTRVENPLLEGAEQSPEPLRQWLYRVKSPVPRYQVVSQALALLTHQAALQHPADWDRFVLLRADGATTEAEDWEPLDDSGRRESLAVTGSDARQIAELTSGTNAVAARVTLSTPRRVELELLAPARDADYLLARDTWEPRWTATVDGKPAQVLRANFCFRAVVLPAGATQVVFEYDASLARLAFAIQSLSWLAVAATLAGCVAREKKRRAPPLPAAPTHAPEEPAAPAP
jgi:hypothetical protein